MTTILITGFGPFPGAPVNPTEPLVRRLARLHRPGLRNVRLIGHVFETSYAAVDRELPELIARHRPDALLMFGVAVREKRLRIETRARNALALLPDAGGAVPAGRAIARAGPSGVTLSAPPQPLLAAVRSARVSVRLSRDAGRYLCNYLCWRAAASAEERYGTRLAAFVHVPPLARVPRPRHPAARRLAAEDLARAGEAIVMALAAAARR